MVTNTSDTTAPGAPIEARLSSVAGDLRDRLLPLVTEIAGASPRPARLVQRLGLDKSLASRLLRALRAGSDMELLHRIPSPTGLRIVLDRSAQADVDPELIRNAGEAVDRFQALLDDTPGGRASLDAHMSDSVLEVRLRRERSSKQAVFKGMSFLLGYYCDALATTLIMQPSDNGRRVDGVEVHHRVGMRRIRPNTPLAVLSLRVPPEEQEPDDAFRLETLDGQPGLDDPHQLLVPDFCTSPMPELEVHRERDHTMISLENGDPSLDSPVSLTTAFCVRNAWIPYRTEEMRTISRGYLLHVPCKLLVRDLFIRDDVYVGTGYWIMQR